VAFLVQRDDFAIQDGSVPQCRKDLRNLGKLLRERILRPEVELDSARVNLGASKNESIRPQ
jgi:hypothetical protein